MEQIKFRILGIDPEDEDMWGHRELRPNVIFRTEDEVAEANRLHSELESTIPDWKTWWNKKVENDGVVKEWEVKRTFKNESKGMEFEVRFGYCFSPNGHQLKLRLK